MYATVDKDNQAFLNDDGIYIKEEILLDYNEDHSHFENGDDILIESLEGNADEIFLNASSPLAKSDDKDDVIKSTVDTTIKTRLRKAKLKNYLENLEEVSVIEDQLIKRPAAAYKPSLLHCPECTDERGRVLSKNQSWCPVCKARCQYQCLECDAYFASSHLVRHHDCVMDMTSLTCAPCQMVFASKSALRGHTQRKHRRRYVFECDKCQYRFRDKVNLEIHKISACSKTKLLGCEYCEFRSSYQRGLDAHMNKVHGVKKAKQLKRHICEKCGRAYSHIGSFNRHLRTMCGKPEVKTLYTCDHCHIQYSCKEVLAKHMSVSCHVLASMRRKARMREAENKKNKRYLD